MTTCLNRARRLYSEGGGGGLAPWLSRSCEVELIVLTARLCSSSPRWPFLSRFNFGEWEVGGGESLSCFHKPVFFLGLYCLCFAKFYRGIFKICSPRPPPLLSLEPVCRECLQGNLTQHRCWYKARGIPVIWVYTSWVLFPSHTYWVFPLSTAAFLISAGSSAPCHRRCGVVEEKQQTPQGDLAAVAMEGQVITFHRRWKYP